MRFFSVLIIVLCVCLMGDVYFGQVMPANNKDASLIVLGPDAAGRIVFSAAAREYSDDELSIIRIDEESGSEVVIASQISNEMPDIPQTGSRYRYELRHASEVMATYSLDLRKYSRLTFLGGTGERALFELTTTQGEKESFVVALGDEIEKEKFDDDEVIRVITGVSLEKVELKAYRPIDWQMQILRAEDGTPIHALEGNELKLKSPVLSAPKRQQLFASLFYKDEQHELREGESLQLK